MFKVYHEFHEKKLFNSILRLRYSEMIEREFHCGKIFHIFFNVMYMYFEVVRNLFNFSIQIDKKNLNVLQMLTYVLIWCPNHGSI